VKALQQNTTARITDTSPEPRSRKRGRWGTGGAWINPFFVNIEENMVVDYKLSMQMRQMGLTQPLTDVTEISCWNMENVVDIGTPIKHDHTFIAGSKLQFR
jgi:hypothetical protein